MMRSSVLTAFSATEVLRFYLIRLISHLKLLTRFTRLTVLSLQSRRTRLEPEDKPLSLNFSLCVFFKRNLLNLQQNLNLNLLRMFCW